MDMFIMGLIGGALPAFVIGKNYGEAICRCFRYYRLRFIRRMQGRHKPIVNLVR